MGKNVRKYKDYGFNFEDKHGCAINQELFIGRNTIELCFYGKNNRKRGIEIIIKT